MKVPGLIAVLMLVAACASKSTAEQPARPTVKGGEFGAPGCFFRQTVQDFQALDDRNLILLAPGRNDAYHIQISPPDPEVRYATFLGFESGSSQICGYAGDKVIFGQHGRWASVIGVYRLDASALAGLRARFAVGPPAQKPEPQPGAGAEIERNIGPEEQRQK